jgi:hypothetical protein
VVIASVFTPALVAEFQVNTQATYDQTDAAIAIDADGDFLTVWSSYHQDGDSGGIFARRFDPNCREVGGEFQINTETIGNQTEPAIAMHEAGSFVVAWHGPGSNEEDISARRFDADGQPVGQEFRVNSLSHGRQRYPRVAASQAGTFVVVWESENPDGEFTAAAQLYNASGLPLSNELKVDAGYDSRYPDAAMDAHGNFVVVWLQDRSTNSIMARLYNAVGVPTNDPFKVNAIDFSSLTRPDVAMQNDGRFVVTWDGHPQSASMDDIHARWYSAVGTALSEEFTVNTTTESSQQNPRISMTEDGEFVIVWQGETGIEGNGTDVFAQRYSPSCTPVGYEFQFNSYTAADQKYPAVAISRTPNFVAAWQSDGQDGSGYGIYAERAPKAPCETGFAVVGYELVAEDRLTRTDFEYTMRLVGYNSSSWNIQYLAAKLEKHPANTVVLDDIAEFSFIEAGSEAESIDTFKVRIDRGVPGSENEIIWRVWECTIECAFPFNCEGSVDSTDLGHFLRNWLSTADNGSQDINTDGKVDFVDFALLAERWTR